jgi:metallo-beta-lactamase class B
MKRYALLTALLAAATPAAAQPSDIDSHIAAAKTAAGLDYRATFVNLCFPTPLPGGGRGAAALLQPRPAPDRGIWYASPYQVFDNLYWLGTRQHSSWALKTSAGIIIIDTNFAWAIEPEILDGMAKLKLNPKEIKYVILSHAHGDHDQGVALLQSKSRPHPGHFVLCLSGQGQGQDGDGGLFRRHLDRRIWRRRQALG